MIKKSDFKPAWWLTNPHLQTVWPTLTRRRSKLVLTRERWELPDGDFLDIDWAGRGNGPLLLILHGLAGSVHSPYAKGLLRTVVACGWRAAFIHFRGCSEEINRLPRTYHSGETSDLAYVVKELLRREPETPLAAVGISLGGNVLLKWLGETGINNPLRCAIAVSVPLELHRAADRMTRGFSRVYQWWLLQSLKKTIYNKFQMIPSPIDLSGINKIRTFWEFDDQITAPLHGFASAKDYYQQASSRQYLKHIQVPTLIIHAGDDPFVTREVIPDERELSDKVIFEISKKGGHVGFISGKLPGRASYWLEQRIPVFLKDYL